MLEKMRDRLASVKDKWQAQSRISRVSWSLALVSLLVVIGIVVYMNTRVQYGVLFSGLSDADAGTVTKELKSENVPYKLTDDGKTVMVAQDKVDQTRINLAVNNKLPNSSTGFELFDNTSVMTTDEDRKVMYQRAVTGELERAIASLNEVQKAKVMLVMPKQSVFDDSSSSKQAKASIVLTLKGSGISTQAVQGITALAAGSVENLSQQNVKVVDSDGNVLSGSGSDDSQANSYSTKYMGIQKAYEKMLADKVKKLLQPLYGSSKIQVSVNLDLNFDSIERKMTTYNNPKIRSENEQTTGNTGTQTGETNNNASNTTAGSSSSNTGSTSRTVNNELDTETTKIISAPGSIKRMTSSVLINGNLSQENQDQIRNLVQTAVGFNQGRGDSLTIQGIDFARNSSSSGTTKTTKKKGSNLWLYILAAVGAVILLAGLIFTFLKLRRRDDDDEDYDLDVTQDAPTTPVAEEPVVSPAPKKEPAKKEEKIDTANEKAKDFAQEHPEMVADLLKAWMKEKK
ncbi:flagellar basal-body MS-ring/collar protein FliF [Liquorilactobacillus satsumensis]|uniref:Flagellar M-ring protein n=2 Tax=Liquorilactobacillus satsumensis TaxID=259059 RepID=A0A0R1V0E9_9LACO|nr:flagellar basal-body MS-ring/collar protein FliF [Liquorilactobacillus satsumensis]AJA34318.1 flagellar M-ring protein FliF [Liquorilactobacillus satsumensis]KRL99165.1 flagellar MS-ring protein [Liquorilactobacillus satsumensis DSM 16230 = JCM 12392]